MNKLIINHDLKELSWNIKRIKDNLKCLDTSNYKDYLKWEILNYINDSIYYLKSLREQIEKK